MGLREQINQRPALILFIIVVVIAVLFGTRIWTKHQKSPVPPPGKAAYTVDDGRTWFFDSDQKIPPFDHKGKPAVRVQLWTYDEQTIFPTIVWRYTAQAKQAIETGQAQLPEMRQVIAQGMEVKKALDPNARWLTPNDDPAYSLLLKKMPPLGPNKETAHPYVPKR